MYDRIPGIDVSEFQGAPDWDAVDASGLVQFVYHREPK